MTSSVKKAPVKRWVDESLKDPRFKKQSTILTEMVCPKIELTDYVRTVPSKYDQLTNKRWSTEYWLSNMIVRRTYSSKISLQSPSINRTKTSSSSTQITNTSRTLYFISFTTPLDQLTPSEYGSSMKEKECSSGKVKTRI